MKKKVFITGGSGFIGRNLVELLKDQYKIFAPNSNRLNLLHSEEVQDYLKKNNFDIVIHCATHNASRISDKDLSKVLYNNLHMFFNLARCNNIFGKMFYFGSGAEYDMKHYIPRMTEEYFDTYVPSDGYGFSKYISAKYIVNTPNIYNLRVFGCFGKYEDWRIRFISNACCRALYDEDISIQQNVYFDYLYIKDLVRVVEKLMNKDDLQYQYYNVCSGKSIDLCTLAEMVQDISGGKIEIRIKSEGLKKEYSGDNTRLLKELRGFVFTELTTAITELYHWYEQNQSQIDKGQLFFDK